MHASRASYEHMSCYLRARHYSLPDLLYFMLRGWTRNSFKSVEPAIRSRRPREHEVRMTFFAPVRLCLCQPLHSTETSCSIPAGFRIQTSPLLHSYRTDRSFRLIAVDSRVSLIRDCCPILAPCICSVVTR